MGEWVRACVGEWVRVTARVGACKCTLGFGAEGVLGCDLGVVVCLVCDLVFWL